VEFGFSSGHGEPPGWVNEELYCERCESDKARATAATRSAALGAVRRSVDGELGFYDR